LVYEKKLGTLASLKRELKLLDGDAGVRIEGSLQSKRCFAFVTRFAADYTVMVYSTEGTSNRYPGRRLAVKEFHGLDDAFAYVSELAKPRVDAYVY
jgi:hypothetical protein